MCITWSMEIRGNGEVVQDSQEPASSPSPAYALHSLLLRLSICTHSIEWCETLTCFLPQNAIYWDENVPGLRFSKDPEATQIALIFNRSWMPQCPATMPRPGFPFPSPTDPGCKYRCHHWPAESWIKPCIDALCRIPSLCWLLIKFPTGLHLAVELTAATLLGWHGSVFFLCTEPSPCGSSDEIVSAYAYRKSRDFVNKPACGIPRKTARQDYTEIFSLSISIKIFEQENPVYTAGSSQGLFILLQRNIDVLILVQEKGPGRTQG